VRSIGAAGSARVRSSVFDVGHGQVGVLIIDVDRAHIEDNTIAAYAPRNWLTLAELAKSRFSDIRMRACAKRLLARRPPWLEDAELDDPIVYLDAVGQPVGDDLYCGE